MTPTETELLDTLIGVKKALIPCTMAGDAKMVISWEEWVKAKAIIDKYQPKECCDAMARAVALKTDSTGWLYCPFCSAKTKPVPSPLLCRHCDQPIERSSTNCPPLWYHSNDPGHGYRCHRGAAETLAAPKEKPVQAEAQPVCRHIASSA